MGKIILLLHVIFALLAILETRKVLGKLEPTKIKDNGIYKLEIQSKDKFLTSTDNTTILATRTRWASRPNQKWKFSAATDKATGQPGWKIATIDEKNGIPLVFKVSYVGHGKYRFINFSSGLCLAGIGSGVVGERNCEKDSPYQRWLVLETR